MPKRMSKLHSAVSKDIASFVATLPRGNSKDERNKLRLLLQAAFHALRSYEFGNASPALAKDIADRIETKLAEIKIGVPE